MFKFDCLDLESLDKIRVWRNEIQNEGVLRTLFTLTKEQQQDFYNRVICNRNCPDKYWAVKKEDNNSLIGMAGIENVEVTNGIGEISLIISPSYRGFGRGTIIFEMLLDKGFNSMRLENIYGECYKCNKYIKFWIKEITKYQAYSTKLPARKFFDGSYYDSLYFNISKYDYYEYLRNKNEETNK